MQTAFHTARVVAASAAPRPPASTRSPAHATPWRARCLSTGHIEADIATQTLRPCSSETPLSRRTLLASLSVATAAALWAPQTARAVQGSTPGRIPGVSKQPDEQGLYTYKRPEGKSGGHGVGWSEIPQYSFKVPPGWEETPVSIADLGGTEIDLRFASSDQGQLSVVVAPVLRFLDVGFNADVRMQELGPPDRIIRGFAPELFGKPLDDEDIFEQDVQQKGGLTYYDWHVKPHNLVSATAVGNRVFIITVSANSRQWKRYQDTLRTIQQSFRVPEVKIVPL